MRDIKTIVRAGTVLFVLVFCVVVTGQLWRRVFVRPRCIVPAAASFEPLLETRPMFGGKTFDKPVQLLEHPAEPGTWFVVSNSGVVERYASADVENGTIVLDIRDQIELGDQWGLQEIALHPRFPQDPRVFVTYVAADEVTPPFVSTVGVFRTTLEADANKAGAPAVLFSEGQASPWHPIAGLRFGPDGYLYIGWGHGQRSGDDPKQLRGTMLRVDVDRSEHGKPYAVPADNPFLDGAYDPAVYALGFRNPWRFSFDERSGALWLGDVGEEGYEEIDKVVAGGEYGWPAWEGTACRLPRLCADQPSIAPVYQHGHAEVCSVIGGYVYRGSAVPALRGKYVYGDTCTGIIWALDPDAVPVASEPVGHTGAHLASFSQDTAGELYIVSSKGYHEDGRPDNALGHVFKLVAASPGVVGSVQERAPESLAQLGCVVPWGPGLLAPEGMIEYAINHPAWEDGAQTRRFMTTLPVSSRAGIEEDVAPPVGSVLMKTYLEDGRPVHTQLLARRGDGLWDAHLYDWNEQGTDALPNAAGSAGCGRCHNPRTGTLRGLTISQLNRELAGVQQIAHLEEIGTLEWRWKGGELPVFPRLADESTSVERRARAYLDVNCSSCHQRGGESGAARFDLRFTIPLAMTGLCNAPANVELPGTTAEALLVPGAPERSMISLRLHRSDLSSMPPGRSAIDTVGVGVVDAWIASLKSCAAEPGT